jgi:uncharacterized OB-fold protein
MTDEPGMIAGECPNGHLTYPQHPRCPDCGAEQSAGPDLSEHTAAVVTWTTATSTPPGVRSPNTLAIVAFDVDGTEVRTIGGVVDEADVAVGDRVEPVYEEQLREPGAGIRHPDSQRWDGYRFRPLD